MSEMGLQESGANDPTVSVVIAVYNAATTVARCVESVVSQTCRGKEVVIIDGGSTDGTVPIIRGYSGSLAFWISEPDRGISHAWNKGIKQVRGDWILMLGADDVLADDKVLAGMAPHLTAFGEAGVRVVYGSVEIVDDHDRTIEIRGRPWDEIREDFLYRKMAIPHQACFCHRSLFSENGEFDERFRLCADYEFLLRELKVGRAAFVPGLVITRMGGGGLSNRLDTLYLLHKEESRARSMHDLRRFSLIHAMKTVLLYLLPFASRLVGEDIMRKLLDTYRSAVGKPRKWSI